MMILAQHGWGPSDKIAAGLQDESIEGVILSPRYLRPDKASDLLDEWAPEGCKVFMDPEYYASRYIGSENSKLGKLEEWAYFEAIRRNDLVTGRSLPNLITKALQAQEELGVTAYVSPNIYVDHADSVNAGISMNFIARSREILEESNLDRKPLFCSLALDQGAISDQPHFEELLDTLTGLEGRPEGFYVLVGGGAIAEDGSHIRSDLYDERVVANWMYLNHVLSINGFRVMNGCAEAFSPLLAMCGAESCATGWHSSQRQFSIAGYVRPPSSGGQQPLVRYMCTHLLGRIKQQELLDFVRFVPEIYNGLPTDEPYEESPTRTQEVLQMWEALGDISNSSVTGDLEGDLERFLVRIKSARTSWDTLSLQGFTAGVEARKEQLICLERAIGRFRRLAELD